MRLYFKLALYTIVKCRSLFCGLFLFISGCLSTRVKIIIDQSKQLKETQQSEYFVTDYYYLPHLKGNILTKHDFHGNTDQILGKKELSTYVSKNEKK